MQEKAVVVARCAGVGFNLVNVLLHGGFLPRSVLRLFLLQLCDMFIKTNYELVYSAELTPGTSLEDIYTRFNIDHPKDFKGHSLSVSDVVVLHQNGQDAAHYVDSFGYKEVPEFLQEQTQQPEKINPLKHVEDTIEQNDNNFDGIINNTPTVDELEAKVKAGEQISLVDLAEAIKADKERGKEKPSIRAQLKADKERTGKKKNAKQKSQDLERS